MKVAVQFTGIDDALREKIVSHIHAHWGEVIISGQDKPSENVVPVVLEIRAEASSAPNGEAFLRDSILLKSVYSVEQIFFWVDAKLGRLTKSEIITANYKASPKSAMSRREFLFRWTGASFNPNDAPMVFAEQCEAKFGCSTCVDACPAPGALNIENDSVAVSSEHCIRCGLCAGVCPVAAIQLPKFSEEAYRGLLAAINDSSAPTKTLVVTCDEQSVEPKPWMDVEEVPGVAAVGIRQLAMAANSSIGVVLVYCPDGLCAGKENTRQAANLVASIAREGGPVIAYFEGKTGSVQLAEVQKSVRTADRSFATTGKPWTDYVSSLKSIVEAQVAAGGLGLTDMEVSDSCTLCNACVESCPHQALAIQSDELVFRSEECTGCGYCEQICPERSITLCEMNRPMKLEPRTVYKDKMIRCTRCDTEFVSARMLKKVSETLQTDERIIKLCPDCRRREIYEKVYGTS
jgi:Fe-S-cluster-containing hydrogenase component 2